MRRVTATAMVIMIASGAFAVALGLPSVYSRSTPLTGSAEEPPHSIPGSLDRPDTESRPVEPPAATTVDPPATTTVETPTAKTIEPPAATTVDPPAARTVTPPAARTVDPPAARTVKPPTAPNRTAPSPATDRNAAVPSSPSQPAVAPRVVAPVDGQRQPAALAAVAFARAQLGKPYVWGGNGEPGFDCSGLTQASYAAAKIAIPRTAQTQYNHGPRLPTGAALQPGDLLFFGTPRDIHHVGISLGGTLMIHAPTFGQTVRIQDYRIFRDYAGASRPAT
jgi:cell wall-associated NlpC family hydrolase